MKKTAKDINERLKILKDKFQHAYSEFHNADPIFKKLNEEMSKIKIQLEKRKYELNDAYDKFTREIAQQITEDENELAKIKNEKVILYPKEIEDWFYNKYLSGYELGGDKRKMAKIIYLSPCQKYAIVSLKGRKYWSGLGTTSYSPAEHYVLELYKSDFLNKDRIVFEGKLTKENKEKLIERIEELKKGWE